MPMRNLTPTEAPPPGRPPAVTILGWAFVAFSVFAVLSSAFALVFVHFIPSADPSGELPTQPKGLPSAFSLLFWMFQYFDALLIGQVALAVFSIFAATQFLRLCAWSRTYFEALNWMALAWTVLFGIVFAAGWVGMSTSLPAPGPAEGVPPPALFAAFGVFISIFVVIFNGAFPAGIIWLLRSRHVRPAFGREV